MSVGASPFTQQDFESPEAYAAAKLRNEEKRKADAAVQAAIRGETLAREASDLAAAESNFWASAAQRRTTGLSESEPEPGSREEINAVERRLSVAKEAEDQFLQHSRYDALERELRSGKLFGAVLVQVEHFVNSWRPVRENLRQAVDDLTRRHRELVARRPLL